MRVLDHIQNNTKHTEMTKSGWEAKKSTKTTHRGGTGTNIDYHKKTWSGQDELKVGAVPRIAAGILALPLNLSKDFREATWEKGIKEFKEGEIIGVERLLRGAAGTFVKVGGVVQDVLQVKSQEYQQVEDQTWRAAWTGKIKTTVTYKNPKDTTPPSSDQIRDINRKYPGMLEYMQRKQGPQLTKSQADEILRFGYTPENRASVQWLFAPENRESGQNRANLFQLEGGRGFIQQNRPGVSSFVFLPGGDEKNAHSVKVWHNSDGTMLTELQLTRAMHDYAVCYEDIKKGIKDVTDKTVERMKTHNPSMTITQVGEAKKKLKEALEQGSYVLDVETGAVRIYTKNLDLTQKNPAGYTTGMEIKLGKEAQRAVALNHNRKLTEVKKDLRKKAFTEELPPSKPPQEDEPLPEE